MQKLLIADPSEEFCNGLASALGGLYEVRICRDGAQVMAALAAFRPDRLIIDLMLPGMDGLGFLQAVAAAGLNTLILPVCSYYSTYIAYALEEMGIHYLMQKPCRPEAVAARLIDLQRRTAEASQPEDAINSTLLMLGLRSDLCGYPCVYTALRLLLEDPGQSVTKQLYPSVAKVCGGTATRVERAIRTVIQDAWLRRDDPLWQLYFSPDQHGRNRCPTNSVFLFRLAAGLLSKQNGHRAEAQ